MDKITTKQITPDEAKQLGVDSWSTWECEPMVFDWYYSSQETAYVFEGDVTVTSGGEATRILPGMLVRFPEGMSCTWDVKTAIRKAYTFRAVEE